MAELTLSSVSMDKKAAVKANPEAEVWPPSSTPLFHPSTVTTFFQKKKVIVVLEKAALETVKTKKVAQ